MVWSVQFVIVCSSWCSLKRAIAFLCELFYRFHFRFRNRSHSARRGEEGKWGHSNSFGGHGLRMPPLGTGPACIRSTLTDLILGQSILPERSCGVVSHLFAPPPTPYRYIYIYGLRKFLKNKIGSLLKKFENHCSIVLLWCMTALRILLTAAAGLCLL